MACSTLVKFACAVLLCMVVAAPHAEAAISCGTVTSKLTPCLSYLKGGPGPEASCCGGIKELSTMAATPADRQAVCGCLKSASGSINGLDYGVAAGLPGKCGVSVPYPISPKTDCSTVN